jgi:outer membrane protein assembly factor BamB
MTKSWSDLMRTLLITLTFLVLALLYGTAAAEDWPMFRHDPAHSGLADEVVEPPLELLWKYNISTGNGNSKIAVFDGVVYLHSQDYSSFSYHFNVIAVDAATGKLKWKYKIENALLSLISSPAVSGGVVYVGSSNNNVYAINAATGTLKWKYKTEGGVLSSPAVSSGVVYVGSNDNNVYAINAATGTLKWKYKTENLVHSSPAVSGSIIYVGSSDNNVYALEAATGTLKWKYKTESGVSSSPAVSGGIVYVGSNDNNVYAIDASTGALKWKYKTESCVSSSPAVSDGIIYVGSNDNNVYAIDASTGALKWKYKTENFVYSSPAVSGGIVYVCSYDSNVHALDAATGAFKWKYETEKPISSSPAVSDGVIYVSSNDASVYAFAPATTTPTPTPASTPTGMPTTTSTSTPPSPTSTSTPVQTAIPHPTFIPTPIPTPKDTSPPAISILNPTIIEYNNNGVLEEGEKVEITYGANDPSGVASIKILTDGAMLESRNRAGTYTVTTNSLPVGTHTIKVEATDSRSNTDSEELQITVERTGPSVYFGTTRTTINKGEDAIFTLSAVNPIGNPPMTVQLILKPPSGVSVTSSSFAKAGSGIYTSTQAIESGDNVRSIEVRLTGSQAGTHEIESEVYYMFEGSSKSPTRYETLTLTIDPKYISTDSESKDQGNGLPGFATVVAVMGLLVAACFIKGNIK